MYFVCIFFECMEKYCNFVNRLENMIMENRSSETIKFLRMPLAIAIVFQHSYGYINSAKPADISGMWAWQAVDAIRGFCSWVIIGAALMAFALISGYLFFSKWPSEDNEPLRWDWRTYGRKMLNRVFSLLIPYIIWNILSAWYLSVPFSWHIFWDQFSWGADKVNVFGQQMLPTYAPADSPLWFIRDLFIISLCAPVLFMLIKYGKHYTVLFFWAVFLLKTPSWTPSITLLPWFVTGAYLSIFRKDLSTEACRIWKPWMWIVIALSGILIPLEGVVHQLLQPLFMMFICLFYFWSATKIVERKPFSTPDVIAHASVAVYAGHVGLGVLEKTASWMAMLIPDGSSCVLLLLRYFLAPLLCVAIITVLFSLIYPSIAAGLLTGKILKRR